MSRIFEALRKLTSEQSGEASAAALHENPKVVDLLGALERRERTAGPPSSLETPQEDLECVKVVQLKPSPGQRLVIQNNQYIPGGESFRLLRYRLDLLRQKKSLTSLMVTSSVPREGKTMIATNLAASFGLVSRRVLLVDADLRKPSASGIFGMGSLTGLAGVLEHRANLTETLFRLEPTGFYFLPAGRTKANPAELLQGSSMRDLMKRVKTTFDWIILDSPPLIPFADGHCLASLSDGLLMVVREAFTTREDFQKALVSLGGNAPTGIVVNQCSSSNDEVYYAHYRPAMPRMAGTTRGKPAAGQPEDNLT